MGCLTRNPSKLHHRHYVDILPDIGQTLTTLYWTDDELEYTKPTSLFNATKEREIQWKSDYEIVKEWSRANDLKVFTWYVVTYIVHRFDNLTNHLGMYSNIH